MQMKRHAKAVDFRGPLPPGVRTGDSEVRMREIPCPNCGKALRAIDVAVMEGGFALGCRCGVDWLEISRFRVESDDDAY